MDIEFQLALANEDMPDLEQAEIMEFRQAYAQDLISDKQFIFGKYVLNPQNGSVCTSSFLEMWPWPCDSACYVGP